MRRHICHEVRRWRGTVAQLKSGWICFSDWIMLFRLVHSSSEQVCFCFCIVQQQYARSFSHTSSFALLFFTYFEKEVFFFFGLWNMWGWNDVLPFGSKLGDHNEKQQWVLGVLWIHKRCTSIQNKARHNNNKTNLWGRFLGEQSSSLTKLIRRGQNHKSDR